MNVLLATDGSDRSRVAEELAAAIAWPAGTRIEVLRVDQELAQHLRLPDDARRALQDSVRRELEAHLAAVAERIAAPGREVRTTMTIGRPADLIAERARKTDADVIVLGSRGRGAIASTLLGSVAAEVVDASPCPVLVARSPQLRGVVVADDGSDGSAEAEEVLASWGFMRDLRLRVASVAEIVTVANGMGMGMVDADSFQMMVDENRALHRGYAEAGVARLAKHGIHATAEQRDGSTAYELIEAAKAAGADLIVVGSRGQTGLARLVLGSVARGVLFHAPMSVLIVRQKVPATRN